MFAIRVDFRALDVYYLSKHSLNCYASVKSNFVLSRLVIFLKAPCCSIRHSFLEVLITWNWKAIYCDVKLFYNQPRRTIFRSLCVLMAGFAL